MNESFILDDQLLQRLPLPLAQLCRRASNARTPLERHQAAWYLWEAALKLLASVAVVEYGDLPSHDPELIACLKNLARPTLGHWWEFLRRLVPVLAERGDAGFIGVRDLLGHARDDLPRAASLDGALLEVLEGSGGGRSRVCLIELIDRLVQYRNRELGHDAAEQRPADHYERMSRVLFAGALEVLDRLDVLAGRRLLSIGEVRQQTSGHRLIELYALTGESVKRLESLELAEDQTQRLPRPDQVYLGRTDGSGRPGMAGEMRPLHPLLYFEPASGQVYFLNARRGKNGIEYLCYGSGDILRRDELRADHRELLARVLDQPVDAAATEAWAAAAGLTEDSPGSSAAGSMSGRYLGDFELLSRLGQGGMGVVYRAWQPSLGRQVALKCTLRVGDPKAEARFSREIRALGRIEHPNVVKVFTSGAEGDQWFYAMELIEGAELSRVCEQLAGSSPAEIDAGQWRQALRTACEQARSQETQLGAGGSESVRPAVCVAGPAWRAAALGGRGHVAQVVDIVRQVAEAAHALHEAGVVHRDIKPGNIMLTADGGHPLLMDLGLAQLADETEGRVTRTRQFVGTLRYASPEQILAAARVDRRTDVYSLGATLWELLTLRPLFTAGEDTSTPELMLKIQTIDPEKPRKYNRHIPRDLEAVVLKCLEKDRGRRYATAADLAADLGRFLSGEPVSAQPASLTYLTGKFVRRYRVPLAVVAGVLAILVGSTVAAFLGIDSQRRAALNANEKLQEQLYDNHIAVAERELTLNQDVGLAGDLLEKCPPHLRGWEWDYLMRLRDGPRAPLADHKGGLWSAVFSPDGDRIATASIDGTVKMWDAASGQLLLTYRGHLGISDIPDLLKTKFLGGSALPDVPRPPVMCLAFSPDGRHIASGSFEPKVGNLRESRGVVKIWDAQTGTDVLTFKEQLGVILSLDYSPDGRRIASSSINQDNTFAVWEAKTGKVIQVVAGHNSHVHRLRYSPDGRLLASGDTDGVVKLWDAATLTPVHSIDVHRGPVVGLAFAPDGTRFASASEDSTVRVWETATAAPLFTLRGHTGSAFDVAFSPDGRRIASAGFDKTVRLWDAASGKEKLTLRGHGDMVWGVAFSPDGRRLVSAGFDKQALLWDATPRHEQDRPRLFTITTGHTDRVGGVAFSPDDRYLASSSLDGSVRLWDGQTGAALRTLQGHSGAVWGVAFSPDSKRLASASWDHKVKIWDAATGDERLTFSGHTAPVQSVAFSPDGKRVASGSWDASVKIWDAESGAVLATCEGDLFPTVAVAFSPDGKRVASGRTDRSVVVWNASTGARLLTLKGHLGAVPCVAFSPDGKRLASASWDHTVKVWDVDPKRASSFQSREVKTLTGHRDRVNSVAFSPDGTRIATASEDKTVRLWDAATGKEILTPPHLHRGLVWSVAFDRDGKRVAAGCWSASTWVKVWDTVGKTQRK